ncbi:MAG: 2Fe-2S iron-sulfur cluster binding domain-containing protein [Ruminococcaceae bacterium]|nr:2Fe-2S iron-sulfur cluster binding domain-containing protein [Oscillospiraceae bacterium]
MAERNYLDSISLDRFDQIVPERREKIEQSPADLPKYEYNANKLARDLHPKVQHVTVTAVKELKDAKVFTLTPDKAAGTQALAYFRAGQYISVSLKIGKSVLTRPYSLCGSPKEALDGTYSIVVKKMKDGFASDYILENWAVGTKLDISAPSGSFNYEPLRDAGTIVGIAGGSGIAPFVSLAKAIADGTEDCSMTLLFGSRTEADILFREELDALCASCDKLKVVHVLSDEEKDGYENGFISAELIKKYAPEGDYSVFVCGSQGMYDFIIGETEKLGLKKRRVRLDAYGEYRLSDKDAEYPEELRGKTCKITVTTSDGKSKVIPANTGETILVALERAGIAAPSKCRSGECGFCRSRLASGEVYTPAAVENRRAFDKKNGYIHPCCTYPKSDCEILINYEKPERVRKVKDMKKKQRTMSVIMAIIISAAMGAIAAYLTLKNNPLAAQGTPPQMMYISNIAMSITVGILCGLFLPFGKWGRALATKAGANPPSMKFTLLNCLPISVGNTLVVSLIVSFFGVVMGRAKAPAEALSQLPPLPVMWLGSWAQVLLPTLVASYLLAVIFSPMVAEMVGMSSAGAEVGAASAENTSVAKKDDAE